jgi:hypothetical protein
MEPAEIARMHASHPFSIVRNATPSWPQVLFERTLAVVESDADPEQRARRTIRIVA